MFRRIATALFISNNGETLAQSLCQIDNYIFHLINKQLMFLGVYSRLNIGHVSNNPPKRILIVDDEVALLRIMREALTASFRCEVDTSPKPEYGFELAIKKTYDLFIFDFSMPMIDGALLFFLIGKVYGSIEPPRMVPPLLLVSGKGDQMRAQDLLKEPSVAGFIAKPFSMNRLLEKVRETVRGIEAPQ